MPKYALYQTVSVGLLFVSVQSKHRKSLFRYWSETTETNCLETNWINQNLLKKKSKYSLCQTVSVALTAQSKHRNSLFRYRSETTERNILFRIMPKLVSFQVSVVSIEQYSKDTLVVGVETRGRVGTSERAIRTSFHLLTIFSRLFIVED